MAGDRAVEKRRDWSDQVFGFALNLWNTCRQSRVPAELSDGCQQLSPVAERIICSCLCHCNMKLDNKTSPSAKRRFEKNGVDGSKKYLSSKLRRSKKRHNSADHVKCIKIFNMNHHELPPISKLNFGSAGHEDSSCDQCDCNDNIYVSEEEEENTSLSSEEVCYDDAYDKRVSLLQHVTVATTPVTAIKQSNSDPTLNTSMCSPNTQNCINENTSISNWAQPHPIGQSPLHRGSISNSSFVSKPTHKNTVTLRNKRNLSFRLSTRHLTKRFSTNKLPERVCPSPGNVKLSAINNLSNKPIDILRQQMDGGKISNNKYQRHSITNINNITSNINNNNNELIDKSQKVLNKSLSSTLRRRRKSFMRSSGVSRVKVEPANEASYGGDTRLATLTAWNDEFDTLHHASCPCRDNKQLKDEMADVTAEMETLDGGEDGKNNPKNKQMSIGRKKFNMDPKKGIEYLIEHGLLKNTPDDISKFLYNGEGLNKTAIGDYLGERHDFNQTVLDAFVALHDFTDLILVQALRQFLWSFRLPGEAQKIDRMMERFAGHYCELNPAIFQHPDTCFVLSFAIIMLNTSLHNPAVKDKQTLEQFIKMNRGIDNGDDLPRELLESLFESIKTEPFKIPEDDGNDLMHTFFNPDREGWLWKQGGRYKSWKRRWFILNDNCLYYFEYTTDKEPRGIIPLENIEVREVHDRNKPHCFELYATSTDFIKACKTDSEGKVVEGKHTVYRMSAATHEEKEEWIKCIRQSISHNPFYDLLAKRKKNIQKNSS